MSGESGTTAETGPLRRRDSMSLLTNLFTHTLDDGYAEAAARRRQGARTAANRPGRAVLVVCLLAVGLLLATAAAQARLGAPAAAKQRDALVERIRARTAATDGLQARLERLRAEVTSAQAAALRATATGGRASSQLAALQGVTGTVPVTGPGISVTVDDATGQPAGSDPVGPDEGGAGGQVDRVLDTDLQRLVNGLWAAGAEAVAINGQRLTSLTAIRSAGEAVLVDYRPLSPPYVVTAVGDPKTLEPDFVDGPGGRWFRTLEDNYGIRFDVVADDDLQLPSASVATLRFATSGGDS